MTILSSIFLGIIQGLTEFLPVSSSGHLVLFQHLFQIHENQVIFDVAVHLGTLLSIITVYRHSLLNILIGCKDSIKQKNVNTSLKLILLIVVASIPTAIIGLVFKDFFEQLFSNLTAVAIAFAITGTLLFVTKKFQSESSGDLFQFDFVESVTYFQALVIGTVQGFAITPGISRSGITISSGILLKMNWTSAALFSFLMSIPAIAGASLLQFKDVIWEEFHWQPLIVGFVFSYLFGVFGLKVILKSIHKGRLYIFSYYLWGLSFLLLIYKWGF
jgi:undecaprenyl-diphosphatase